MSPDHNREAFMADIVAPSDTVLEEIATRALKFFSAVSTNPYIRATLGRRGYTDAHHEKGWELVLKASGYKRPAAPALNRPDSAAAIAELDKWDEPTFRIARAALGEFPDQRDFVFANLQAQTGAAAVVGIATFLDRLDNLENAKDRKATRKTDHAALAKLAERGIGSDERARVRALLKLAMTAPDTASVDAKAAASDAAKNEEQRQAQIALWTFHAEWSEIARADIKRRDYLIQLGLAKRKAPKKSETNNESADQ
jgi:hypothetical protein